MPSLTRTEDAGLQSYRTLRQTRRAISRARTLQARALVQVEQVRECLDGRVAVQLCGEIGRSRRLALLRAALARTHDTRQKRWLLRASFPLCTPRNSRKGLLAIPRDAMDRNKSSLSS
eukprot:1360653-Pleurochrysis_carterae.AAC.1